MAFCVVKDCHNQSDKNRDVSFHSFPKDKNLKRKWETNIKRTEYPKFGKVCSNHFEEGMFERNLKAEMCPELYGARSKTKRRLVPDAVPTIFPYQKESAENHNLQRSVSKK